MSGIFLLHYNTEKNNSKFLHWVIFPSYFALRVSGMFNLVSILKSLGCPQTEPTSIVKICFEIVIQCTLFDPSLKLYFFDA